MNGLAHCLKPSLFGATTQPLFAHQGWQAWVKAALPIITCINCCPKGLHQQPVCQPRRGAGSERSQVIILLHLRESH